MRLSSTLKYDNPEGYLFDVSYYLKRDIEEEKLESLISQTSFKVNNRYSIFGHYSYDITDKAIRGWGVGYEMKKRCWNYKLEYKQEYTPISQTDGTESKRDSMLYFLIELFPLGGFDYKINEL